MKRITTACFTGHRPAQLPFTVARDSVRYNRLANLLDYYIVYLYRAYGVTTFISGMALGVDMLAAERVLALRSPELPLKLICALPCEEQAHKWQPADRSRYLKICDAADEVIYIDKEYTADCMQKRNRFMVKSSAYCIAVWNGDTGGTSSTVRLARKDKLTIFIIDPNDFTVSVEKGEPELGLFDM